MCAQACHASRNCGLLASRQDPELLRIYQGPKFLGTQIILTAKDQPALLRAYREAESLGLIASLIIDEGHIMPPLFDGSPIITALGIGPCTKDQVKRLTRGFRLAR